MPATTEICFTGTLTAARRDDAPREVELPPELERVLNDAARHP